MNGVMIIPTGLGFRIGGHAGDATPAALLLAKCCHKLILHPNVVNASNIIHMPKNALYVEGSILDRFLEGDIGLREVKKNKILLVCNETDYALLNTVSAAVATGGMDIDVLVLRFPLLMKGWVERKGEYAIKATGSHTGTDALIHQVRDLDFDALAIVSPIEVEDNEKKTYIKAGRGVNPWGGIEAIVSGIIASALNKPVAHAPTTDTNVVDMVVDPRQAAEWITATFFYCILEGLRRAPRVSFDIGDRHLMVEDIDVLISPAACYGPPHSACEEAGIPIIEVTGNTTEGIYKATIPNSIKVRNYVEAAGMIMLMRAGLNIETVTRPLRSNYFVS